MVIDAIDQVFRRFPVLETDNLLLRELVADDAEEVMAIFADEAVTEFYDLYTFQTPAEATELIEHMRNSYEQERQIRWAITRKEDDRLIGTCGFVVLYQHRGEIGYDLARAYWGRGIMAEALRAVVRFGFDEMALNRIEALVMPGNRNSTRLLDKLGFVHEGTLREYDFFKDQFQDLDCFSILRRDVEADKSRWR